MKLTLSPRHLFLLCGLLLVVSNGAVLAQVYFNRTGEPESHLVLTERELRLPYATRTENSGMALRLNWQSLGEMNRDNRYSAYQNRHSPAWLDADKMESLGFTLTPSLNDKKRKYYKKSLPKEVYIVLEFDGSLYQESLHRAEDAVVQAELLVQEHPENKEHTDNLKEARETLVQQKTNHSRLFTIDGGTDPEELRRQYKDRSRFIILKGLVRLPFCNDCTREKISGVISQISASSLHVPLRFKNVLHPLLTPSRKKVTPPRYSVELAFGSRFEPWIISVQKLPPPFQ